MICNICKEDRIKDEEIMALHMKGFHPEVAEEKKEVPQINYVKEVVECDCPCKSWGPVTTCPNCGESYPSQIMTLHLRVRHGI